MPVHHKKYRMETAEDLMVDIICSSLPHSPRFARKKNEKTNNKKTEENMQETKETKA